MRAPGSRQTAKSTRRIFLVLLAVGLTYAGSQLGGWLAPESRAPDRPGGAVTTPDSRAGAEITNAFQNRLSGIRVEATGVVERLLSDDRQGSQHQRFIVRLEDGHTVLISHNIDLAPRLPVNEGDSVHFRGQFEWNPRGGVVHWTHHDPQGQRQGGFIRHRGQRYE